MSTDTPEFWNEIWAELEDCGSGSDEILADQVEGLTPGRVLEIGCGTGGNAVWLAKQGWKVTAVDYSKVAIEKGKQMAAEQGLDIEFMVADASAYLPQDHFDLITCFYIQLFPAQRAAMLSNVSKALAPGGTLLFVSHDKSGPPSGWSEEDLLSLTTPEEIAAELPGLEIEQAYVFGHDTTGTHSSHMRDNGGERISYDSQDSSTTVVRATRPL